MSSSRKRKKDTDGTDKSSINQTTTTTSTSPSKNAKIDTQIHYRVFEKEEEPDQLDPYSQIDFMSSLEQTLSQPVTDNQAVASSSGFFSSASSNYDSSSDDDDYDDNSIKRQRSVTTSIDPTMVAVKAAFMAALEQFYESPAAKAFDQGRLAAYFTSWFAQALGKPELQMLARSTASSVTREAKETERQGYVDAFNILKRSGFATASILVPPVTVRDDDADPTGPIIRQTPNHFEQEFRNFMRNNLRIYTFTKCPRNSDYSQTIATLQQKFIERPNLDFAFLSRVYLKAQSELINLENFILDRITAKLPTNTLQDLTGFVKLFLETKLNRLTKIYKVKAPERAPLAVAHIMQEMGKLIQGERGIKKEVQALGEIFVAAGAVQIAQLEAAMNANASVNNGHLLNRRR